MKICFLVSSLGAGGAERVATTLCKAWAERGDHVTLISTFSAGGPTFYPVPDSVELISLASVAGIKGKSIRSYAKRFMALRALLRQRDPDVVVSFLPNVNVAAVLSTAFLKVPVIVCERNDPSSRPRSDIWEMASRLTYRYASMMTVQTDAVAQKIHRYYPGLRAVRVVPNPLPARIAGRRMTRPVNARKVLLSMGRFNPQKQVDKSIEAFTLLASRFDAWDLHIYGEGPLRSDLESQIRGLGMEQRIFLKGRTGDPWDVMSASDAFLMTSMHEGFPNALLEAMGLGLPCVVTDCPSGPRQISRNGADALLVPLEDRDALLAALASVMNDEGLRNALGERARESVSRRFGLASVIDEWDRIFTEVIAASQSGRHGTWRSQ